MEGEKIDPLYNPHGSDVTIDAITGLMHARTFITHTVQM